MFVLERKKTCFYGTIEKVALQVEEDKISNLQANTSDTPCGRTLDLPSSIVQKIAGNILRYYPYKLQLVQELLPHDFETRHLLSAVFLLVSKLIRMAAEYQS
ncbi:hypothetical protein TNCV_4591471 [Trichonephila clavipes]|nr:hypothetical protein TNCV_4591471 [Trichonephila clavipes]